MMETTTEKTMSMFAKRAHRVNMKKGRLVSGHIKIVYLSSHRTSNGVKFNRLARLHRRLHP